MMEEQGVIKIHGPLSEKDSDEIIRSLNGVWGILQADVNKESGEARIDYDKNAASFQDFQQAIRDSGYDIKTENQNSPH
ncbi:heavy-metal-associated domain-containing protein [Peribacillus frigoritolerans]|uniref:heavy-metal-associated domain-containing protein n=2 Tax=Peribacillus frigoritolerans TaxID=450367 RepID=UPI002E1EE45C|nr:heavy-metal-associated domain-containing protein [Peribacillus frigoritolerans]MED3848643.1 heavy-metal-associated domain-containing protein [Peribacillus frigoritolerans]WVN08887.1 heavy-metal-associated domain-containing protein [Peribacillus frigoritolerans]